MRTLALALLALTLLPACSDGSASKADTEIQQQLDALQQRVDELEAKLGSGGADAGASDLPGRLATVEQSAAGTATQVQALQSTIATLQQQVDALTSSRPLVPHLIVAATGEDLGVVTDASEGCAWNEADGAEECYAVALPFVLAFSAAGCTGSPSTFDASPRVGKRIPAPDGSWWEIIAGPLASLHSYSVPDDGEGCHTDDSVQQNVTKGRLFAPVKRAPSAGARHFDIRELSVEPR